MIEPNGGGNSAVATLDGRSRKKKIPMNNTKTVIIIMMYFTISQAHYTTHIYTGNKYAYKLLSFLYGLHIRHCLMRSIMKIGFLKNLHLQLLMCFNHRCIRIQCNTVLCFTNLT